MGAADGPPVGRFRLRPRRPDLNGRRSASFSRSSLLSSPSGTKSDAVVLEKLGARHLRSAAVASPSVQALLESIHEGVE